MNTDISACNGTPSNPKDNQAHCKKKDTCERFKVHEYSRKTNNQYQWYLICDGEDFYIKTNSND